VGVIREFFQAFECLAWLHNCTKVLVWNNLISFKILSELDYWMIERAKLLYFNKNKEQALKQVPRNILKMI
jgi:hypothetical protein